MRVYLVGYMGSGKSTLGKELANRLGLSFLDLDKYIENKYFKTVPAIFKEEGEQGFRQKEHICLLEVCEFEDVVVATGGGAPCHFDHMDLMNRTGYCVFLDVETDDLAHRLMNSKEERPLIKGKTAGELLEYINMMLPTRLPFYEKARYIVSGKNISPDVIIEKLRLK